MKIIQKFVDNDGQEHHTREACAEANRKIAVEKALAANIDLHPLIGQYGYEDEQGGYAIDAEGLMTLLIEKSAELGACLNQPLALRKRPGPRPGPRKAKKVKAEVVDLPSVAIA